MSRRHRLSDDMRWVAIGRLEAGQRQSEVARALDVNRSIISRLWNRYNTERAVSRRPVSGRPRVTTVRDDRYLCLQARRHRTCTAHQLAADLVSATGRAVSRQTVSRRLHEGQLYARRPVVCVPLTSAHRRERLNWARDHLHWTPRQWGHVLFTDESRFGLRNDSRRQLVWRTPRIRYQTANIRERHGYSGGGWMVWAGIAHGARTDLHIFPGGTVTGVRYRDDILAPYVRPFLAAMGPDAMFMDDNARVHRARVVQQYEQAETLLRMDWPSRSPDLNPIEHVWDMLRRRLTDVHDPPRTLSELRTCLSREWSRIPQIAIDNLIVGMNRRCRACVASRGGHIPY